jgi:hypothetical protein
LLAVDPRREFHRRRQSSRLALAHPRTVASGHGPGRRTALAASPPLSGEVVHSRAAGPEKCRRGMVRLGGIHGRDRAAHVLARIVARDLGRSCASGRGAAARRRIARYRQASSRSRGTRVPRAMRRASRRHPGGVLVDPPLARPSRPRAIAGRRDGLGERPCLRGPRSHCRPRSRGYARNRRHACGHRCGGRCEKAAGGCPLPR